MRGSTEEETWWAHAGTPALRDAQYNMMLILRISEPVGLTGGLQINMPALFSVYAKLMCRALHVSGFHVALKWNCDRSGLGGKV